MTAIPEAMPKKNSVGDRFTLRAKKVKGKHMRDPAFGAENFAEEMHLSRAQLLRKIKALTGIFLSEFIHANRLQKAAALISAKADTPTYISHSVPFNAHPYFAERFRKKFGVCPSEYTNTTNFTR
jgi:AraC-like DNA-binding protein